MHTDELGVGGRVLETRGILRKLNLNSHSYLVFILEAAFAVQVCQNVLCHHCAQGLRTRENLKERAFLQKAIY